MQELVEAVAEIEREQMNTLESDIMPRFRASPLFPRYLAQEPLMYRADDPAGEKAVIHAHQSQRQSVAKLPHTASKATPPLTIVAESSETAKTPAVLSTERDPIVRTVSGAPSLQSRPSMRSGTSAATGANTSANTPLARAAAEPQLPGQVTDLSPGRVP